MFHSFHIWVGQAINLLLHTGFWLPLKYRKELQFKNLNQTTNQILTEGCINAADGTRNEFGRMCFSPHHADKAELNRSTDFNSKTE